MPYDAKLVSAVWREYAVRNDHLREMGFADYHEYLASPLWAEIRARVMARTKHGCHICHEPAVAIHHRSYLPGVLAGESGFLWALVPLCEFHHRAIEFDRSGEKLPLSGANRKLKNMYRKNHPKLGKYGVEAGDNLNPQEKKAMKRQWEERRKREAELDAIIEAASKPRKFNYQPKPLDR